MVGNPKKATLCRGTNLVTPTSPETFFDLGFRVQGLGVLKGLGFGIVGFSELGV